MKAATWLMLFLTLTTQAAIGSEPHGLLNPLHKLHTECSLTNLLACIDLIESERD
jgi:hypothetical protein